ncbi:TraB/GumN family protein [Pontibacter mangrovi]|uniref:TraB/GumN family protein n=1 Tax=Pontibacter mangrovi TaxID=2589816 RepID=A0A501WBC6_9BACT|nr:TraB/GumN family protein [Pontibacter mangrovi]TPE44501.1 TraB/GumN family protein [Pontibacter mangrovi]
MKKIPFLLWWVVLLVFSCSTERETKSGIFWKITSNDGNESFLYGTMHEYPEGRIAVSKKVLSALRTCKTLALERDLKNVEDQRIFLQNDKHKVDLKANQVIASRYNLKSMEGELVSVANSNNIKIRGLETAKELLDVLDKVPHRYESQTEEQTIEHYEQLINIYNSELIDYFADEFLVKEFGDETRKLVVNQRTLNWLDDIEGLVKEDKTFIAVGMGHLGGKNGLLNLLKNKGYKLERIRL